MDKQPANIFLKFAELLQFVYRIHEKSYSYLEEMIKKNIEHLKDLFHLSTN